MNEATEVLTPEQARAVLTERQAEAREVDAEIERVEGDLARLDALPEVRQVDLLAMENTRRVLRKLEGDRAVAAAAVRAAQTDLRDAERREARERFHAPLAAITATTTQIEELMSAFEDAFRAKHAALAQSIAQAQEAAPWCGEAPPSNPAYPWIGDRNLDPPSPDGPHKNRLADRTLFFRWVAEVSRRAPGINAIV